jgi:hypothetical protein
MNDRDQTDEHTLTPDVSDEALEAASGAQQEGQPVLYTSSNKAPFCVDC